MVNATGTRNVRRRTDVSQSFFLLANSECSGLEMKPPNDRVIEPNQFARVKRSLSPGWMLFVLTGLNLFNYLDRFIIAAVLTPLKSELHISDGNAGRIVT